jgi:hypothetical protein
VTSFASRGLRETRDHERLIRRSASTVKWPAWTWLTPGYGKGRFAAEWVTSATARKAADPDARARKRGALMLERRTGWECGVLLLGGHSVRQSQEDGDDGADNADAEQPGKQPRRRGVL